MRRASLLVADDFTTSLVGKMNLLGIYGGDMVIPHENIIATQLVFFFIMESDPDRPPKRVSLHVELPGGDRRDLNLPMDRFFQTESDKELWTLRYPLLYQMAVLRSGKIKAKLVHDEGEIVVHAPHIVVRPIIPFPNASQPPSSQSPPAAPES